MSTAGIAIALPTAELRAIAQAIVDDPDTWGPLVRADPEHRQYKLLRDDEAVTIWVISWMDGHDTGFHDHDVSAGALAVAAGKVVDERLRVGGPPKEHVLRAGEVLSFEAEEIHRVRHVAGRPAVTIHVYSPPLQRSGAYVIDDTGALLRRPQDGEEELRPLRVA